jgi:hypothetical protein
MEDDFDSKQKVYHEMQPGEIVTGITKGGALHLPFLILKGECHPGYYKSASKSEYCSIEDIGRNIHFN